MAKLKQQYESDGYFGIGILHARSDTNIGTLWRTAYIMGASYIFTIDRKYKKQSTDIAQTWSRIPLFHYDDFDAFYDGLPRGCQLVGVELTDDSVPIAEFNHPPRAVYLLGCENVGLPRKVLDRCHSVISLPGNFSVNVAVAGSLVAYDRVNRIGGRLPLRTDVPPEH